MFRPTHFHNLLLHGLVKGTVFGNWQFSSSVLRNPQPQGHMIAPHDIPACVGNPNLRILDPIKCSHHANAFGFGHEIIFRKVLAWIFLQHIGIARDRLVQLWIDPFKEIGRVT